MSTYRSRQPHTRRNGRRTMGMPDPMMIVGAGAVILVVVLVLIFTSNRPAQSQAKSPTPQKNAAAAAAQSTEALQITRISPTVDPKSSPTQTAVRVTQSATVDGSSRTAKNWKKWPVVPEFTAGAKAIFLAGQEMGRNPKAFSKIGDCESSATWFLEDFDKGPESYALGVYAKLEKAIQYFSGSLGRTSLAARDGARVSTLFSAIWSDRAFCEVDETPLECEFRVHNPAFAIISLGSNDIDDAEKFEKEMREVIQITKDAGVVPILATKADDLEGGGLNNMALAKLALEFDLPLWNFWAAVQDVPNGGLDWDGAHLSWSDNYFDQPGGLDSGWAMRNLTALQVLDAMRAGVQSLPTQ